LIYSNLPGNALRDYDYMKEKYNVDNKLDPFYLVNDKMSDWAIMNKIISRDEKVGAHIMKDDEIQVDEFGNATNVLGIWTDDDPALMGGGRGWVKHEENRAGFILRFWFGMAGGIALIGPMLLIILHDDRTTALATASVATLLFALAMASYHEPDASPLAVVGATASYAAVLVVLVSTAL